MQKPSIPKGTRDFLPRQVLQRKYIMNTLEKVFQKYAFLPIETPTMENLSTLTGKYGEEGDKLLFKVLNSGNFAARVNEKDWTEKNTPKLSHQISDKGLRYDLTVPMARFVVQHQNNLTFPFRRYQMQQVWRADRPQKGRYREFLQCDVDIVGTNSLINELDLILIYEEVFSKLGLENISIQLNHRKMLEAMLEFSGAEIDFGQFAIIIDKWDKIGEIGVRKLLFEKGFDEKKWKKLNLVFNDYELDKSSLNEIKKYIGETEKGAIAIKELNELLAYKQAAKCNIKIKLNPKLARGLDYYTGCIFEVVAEGYNGSISGGGRYDNLTEIFGLKGVSGVGISFGLDRIYNIMEDKGLFPNIEKDNNAVLFCCYDNEDLLFAAEQVNILRQQGIKAMVYPTAAKMKKQMNYANQLNFTWCAIVGSNERATKQAMLKNLKTGKQSLVNSKQLIAKVK